MMKPLLLVIAVGACSQSNSTPLDQLNTTFGDTSLEVVAGPRLIVELHVANTASCPTLGDDVVAKFDGVPLNVARGGAATNSTGCYPIAFWLDSVPVEQMAAFEVSSGNAGSQMVIEDFSASWNIAPTNLFTTKFVIDAAASRIVWQNVSSISTATVVPHVDVKIDGSNILYPAGTKISHVEAYAHPTLSQCAGPTTCMVDLEGSQTFPGDAP